MRETTAVAIMFLGFFALVFISDHFKNVETTKQIQYITQTCIATNTVFVHRNNEKPQCVKQ